MDIDVIVLAAGESRRLGRAKQLLPFRGVPLVVRAITAVAQARPRRTVVVLGARANDIRGVITALPVVCEVVENRDWASGMGSSIAAGMRVVAGDAVFPPPAGVLLMVCDQPLIPAGHFARLRAAFAAGPQHVVASRYRGQAGVPAIFPRARFADLQILPARGGAKHVIAAQPRVVHVPCAEACFDVDTEADYGRLLAAGAAP
jgi:molybdenum cofactor cytidylyltransferase